MHLQPSRRRRGVDPFVETDERDVQRLEVVEQGDQVLQVAPQPIELPRHDDVELAALGVLHQLVERRPPAPKGEASRHDRSTPDGGAPGRTPDRLQADHGTAPAGDGGAARGPGREAGAAAVAVMCEAIAVLSQVGLPAGQPTEAQVVARVNTGNVDAEVL